MIKHTVPLLRGSAIHAWCALRLQRLVAILQSRHNNVDGSVVQTTKGGNSSHRLRNEKRRS